MHPETKINKDYGFGMYCLKLLLKYKKDVIINIFIIFILGLFLALIIPKTYKAHGSIMLPPESSQSYSGLVGNIAAITRTAGGLGSAAKSIGFKGSVQEADIMAAIMESRTIREDVVNKCGLIDLYKMQKAYSKNRRKAIDEAIKILAKNTKISVSTEEIISVDVVASAPSNAAYIVNQYFNSLDNYNKTTSNTRSGKLREFIERRLFEQNKYLFAAEESLLVFQRNHKTVSLTDEMRTVIEGVATLESKKIANQVHIDAVSKYLGPNNPEVMVLLDENEAIQKRIDATKHGSQQLFASFASAPGIGMELTRRYRILKIQEDLVAFLTMQYEQAKLEETRDTPSFQILDEAEPPVRKYRPLRSLIVAACCFIGLLLGLILAYLKENIGKIINNIKYFKNEIEGRST